MFAAPPLIDTEIYARLPDELRIADTPTAWSDARGGPPLHSFLEGPSFDRDGNLYCVVRLPLHAQGTFKCGMFLQLSGGLAGPDGMAIGADGSLVVVHAGFGTVWVFDSLGEPVARIRSCAGVRTTNVAFGGPHNKSLFITEAEHGVILHARLDFAGRPMYSHQ